MTTATVVRPLSKFNALPSGNYSVVDNGDGTSDILDVPIISEMKKGWKGAPEDLGRAWLQKLVDNHQRLALQDRHFKPVHVQHHELFVKPEKAGFLLPTRVGQLKLKGKDIWTAFADLKRVPNHVVDAIEQEKLSYVSVEVRSWENATLSSLAIMDTDDPFWEYPMLGVTRKFQKSDFVRHEESVGPVMASLCNEDGSGAILLSFRGGNMAFDNKDDKNDPSADDDKNGKGNDATGSDQKGKMADANKEQGGASVENGGLVKLMQEQLSMLNTGMQAVLAAMNKLVSGFAQPGANANHTQAPVDQTAATAGKLSAKEDAKFDKLTADVDALLKEKTVAKLLVDASKQLEGWHLGSKAKERLQFWAEKDLTGALLKNYIDDYKANVPKEPPRTLAEMESSQGRAAANDDQAVLKFAADGPEALTMARECSMLFDDAQKRGHVGSMSRERFIELEMKNRRGLLGARS